LKITLSGEKNLFNSQMQRVDDERDDRSFGSEDNLRRMAASDIWFVDVQDMSTSLQTTVHYSLHLPRFVISSCLQFDDWKICP